MRPCDAFAKDKVSSTKLHAALTELSEEYTLPVRASASFGSHFTKSTWTISGRGTDPSRHITFVEYVEDKVSPPEMLNSAVTVNEYAEPTVIFATRVIEELLDGVGGVNRY